VVASSFSDSVFRKQKRKPQCPSPARNPSSLSPVGLTPNLKAKSRTRRQRQRALAEIVDHAPKRRNDLLPKLMVSYVPIDELRQAPRRVAFAGRTPSKSRGFAPASKSSASASRSS
jgi:hypothetical protein